MTQITPQVKRSCGPHATFITYHLKLNFFQKIREIKGHRLKQMELSVHF